ncbi:MAG: hypothetical protein GY833_06095 [Aestuariibacter sp.]|nr:hypothetical protein [Aestuariibacter sp.]
MAFIENKGQFATAVKFQVQSNQGIIWLTEDALWFRVLEQQSEIEKQNSSLLQSTMFKLSFPDANPTPTIEPFDRLETRMSYFVGKQPEQRVTNVAVWGGVRYVDLYSGLDLQVTSDQDGLVLRLTTRGGALNAYHQTLLQDIRLQIEGANSLATDGKTIYLATDIGEYTFPLIQIAGDVNLPELKPLIIGNQVLAPFVDLEQDAFPQAPNQRARENNSSALLYGTFLGRSHDDYGQDMVMDKDGSIYITGWTQDFPFIGGSGYDWDIDGIDAFIVKLTPDQSTPSKLVLECTTFLGGASADRGYAIALDKAGNIYVTGETFSSDFPTTTMTGGQFGTQAGRSEAFVAKLTPDCQDQELTYSTILRGELDDRGNDIALDADGNAYIVGHTRSTAFPVTADTAYEATHQGREDIFVAKLDANGERLYATFIGGSEGEVGIAIAIDTDGYIYIVGDTWSLDFPTTINAYQGRSDVFVIKLDLDQLDQTQLVYSLLLGGDDDDHARDIAIDKYNQSYIVGDTWSHEFPTTIAAFQTEHRGKSDTFVIKLDAGGSELLYATLLGGTAADGGHAIAVDETSNAYLIGYTESHNFPRTFKAYDTTYNGEQDVFFARLGPTGTDLTFATFLGGSQNDVGKAFTITNVTTSSTQVYMTGHTISADYPITNAYESTHHGNEEVFVSVLDLPASDVPILSRLLVPSPYWLTNQSPIFLARVEVSGTLLFGSNNVSVKVQDHTFPLYDDGLTGGDFGANDGLYVASVPITIDGATTAKLFLNDTELDAVPLTVIDDPNLVILTDWDALYDEFRDTGMGVREDLNQNGNHDFFELVERINVYASAAYNRRGVAVNLPQVITQATGYSENYASLLYTSTTETRYRMGLLIDELIAQLCITQTNGSIKDVAIVGDDQVVPFYRVFDPTDYHGEYNPNYPDSESRERGYPDTVGGIQGNTVLTDVSQAYIMSDVPYSIQAYNVINSDVWTPTLGHTSNISRPIPNLGIGRVFALHPIELINAIDRYEMPLFLTHGSASAAIFASQDPTITFTSLINRSIITDIKKLTGNQFAYYKREEQEWFPETFVSSLGTNNLTTIWGHANHEIINITGPVSIRASDLYTLSSNRPSVLIGFGCHLGLSVSNYPDGSGLVLPFSEALVNPLLAEGVTFFAPSSQAYVWPARFPEPNVHELMATLFINSLVDSNASTIGDVWQRIFPTYHTNDPSFVERENPATKIFHIAGAYGNVLYGLPTQPIERKAVPTLIQQISSSAFPLDQTASFGLPDTITVDVPHFKVEQFDTGETLFSVPDEGTHLAPTNGPALPLIVRTLSLPDYVTDVSIVEVTNESNSSIYPTTPVTLARFRLQTSNGEPVPGDYQIPSIYPQEKFDYFIARNENEKLLTISIVPMQYNAQIEQVTLYNHLVFEIHYTTEPSNGPTIEQVNLNHGHPLPINQTRYPVQVDIESDRENNISLLWVVRNLSGHVVTSGNVPAAISDQVTRVSFALDATNWEPGLKDMAIYIKAEDSFTDSWNRAIRQLPSIYLPIVLKNG